MQRTEKMPVSLTDWHYPLRGLFIQPVFLQFPSLRAYRHQQGDILSQYQREFSRRSTEHEAVQDTQFAQVVKSATRHIY